MIPLEAIELQLDQVRAIRGEIRDLVTELIHDKDWAREPRPRPRLIPANLG